MKIKLNKNSWHYQIASKRFFCFDDPFYRVNDLCQYTRDFILGSLLLIGITIILVFVGYSMVIDPIAFFITIWKYNAVRINEIGAFGLVMWLLIFTFYLAYKITELDYSENFFKSDSFLYNAYKNIKDKTCVRIEWDEK